MVKPASGERAADIAPAKIAEGIPEFPGRDFNWILQGLFEIKGALGRVEKAVESLEAHSEKHDAKIGSLQKAVWTATGGVIVIIAILGFIADKLLPALTAALAAHH